MNTFKELASKLNTEVTPVETIEFEINDNWAIEIFNKTKWLRDGYDVHLVFLGDYPKDYEIIQSVDTLGNCLNVVTAMTRVFNLPKNNTNEFLDEAKGLIIPTHFNWNEWNDSLAIIYEALH